MREPRTVLLAVYAPQVVLQLVPASWARSAGGTADCIVIDVSSTCSVPFLAPALPASAAVLRTVVSSAASTSTACY